MIEAQKTPHHRFRVHADDHPVRIVQETSFEAAALAYIEDFISSPPVADLRLFVTDTDDGHQRCFFMDLETCAVEVCA